MKITIDNLGVVRHIEFDTQKPLSLFCGPNGTGKTYVAYVLYPVLDFARFVWDGKTISQSDNFQSGDEEKYNLEEIFGVSDEFVSQRFQKYELSLPPVSKLERNSGFRTWMLTVERNSIYTFKTELFLNRNVLIDRMLSINERKNSNISELLQSNARRYPLPIRHDLLIANDLDNIKKVKGYYYDFAVNVENTLLHGKVEVSSTGEVEFIVGENINLPIQMSSSIVKTMSSLILYLKYILKKGDTLIIDEPEMNLHPDNQILLARIFAQMVNMGIKLVISTHSDYIIREFNNLIMLSGVSDNDMQSFSKMGYDKSMMLKNNDVAAYMFNFDKENLVTVENLDVTETGFDVPTIDAAINSINEASEELYYSLKSRQNETEHRND